MGQSADVIINADRVWARHMELAAIGATEGGGVHRLALSDLDIEAHRLLARWAGERGYSIELDAIGNMFIRRPGVDSTAAPVASGSHTDTQPFGGRFDGAFGVLAAFEALEALDDAGLSTRRPIDVAIWNNEEGARFMPGLSGSAVYVGASDLDEMLDCTDAEGVTMRTCVDRLHGALPDAIKRDLGQHYAGFVEAHIEQGTILEESGAVIGVVTDIQGNRRFAVRVRGESAHSGTTPRARRKDAFITATDIAVALRDVFQDEEDIARFTIGMFEVRPGAKSVVPGEVDFFIDFRHPSAAALKEMGDQVSVVAERHAGPCEVTVDGFSNAPPLAFSQRVTAAIARSAERRGFGYRQMISCAGHDARNLAAMCQTAMVFIPCWQGISHNEQEYAEPDHVAAGTQVIADVLVDMANEA
ncbi:MAG: M20 family metallo-hydrolase [Hyphomicrobiaceae bacterium]